MVFIARSFVLQLTVPSKRSLLGATFGMLYHQPEFKITAEGPEVRWYERAFAPVLAGAFAGSVAELMRTAINPVSAGAGGLIARAALGALAGAFVVLLLALGWTLAALFITHRRRAA
jgi:hypothetical protein